MSEDHPSFVATLVILLGGSTLIGFGYIKAVMDRANKDYKATKAAVPNLRRAFWGAWWKAVKIGALVFIVGFGLIAWMVHDVRGGAGPDPVPASSAKEKK